MESIEDQKRRIIDVFRSFGIECSQLSYNIGSTVIFYEFTPKIGSRLSRLKNYMDDITLSLGGSARIVLPVPGRGTIGIEMPHDHPQTVLFSSIMDSADFQNLNYPLPIILGKNGMNENCVIDLVKQPHLLIAGSQGFGKTVFLRTIIYSLLHKKQPNELRFVLMAEEANTLHINNSIIEKYLAEFSDYKKAIITDVCQAIRTLESLCVEMNNRFDLLRTLKCRSIDECHQFPYIVVIIDEYANFLMSAGNEFLSPLCHLAQLGRTVGIHLVITTKRTVPNIISGTIKAHFQARIAFRTCCTMDSYTIIDRQGAESLLRPGDMLFDNGMELIRLQGAFVDKEYQQDIAQPDLSEPYILPSGDSWHLGYEEIEETEEEDMDSLDPLFEDVARLIMQLGKCSHAMISESFSISNVRTAKIMRQLENAGIIEYKVDYLTDKELRDIMENDLMK